MYQIVVINTSTRGYPLIIDQFTDPPDSLILYETMADFLNFDSISNSFVLEFLKNHTVKINQYIFYLQEVQQYFNLAKKRPVEK